MQVTLLCGPSTGGIRSHVATLAADLTQAGCGVVLAAPAGVFPAAVHDLVEVPVPTGMDPVSLVRAARRLRAVVPRGTVVHAHGLKAGWVALVARRAGVITVHNVVLDPVGPAAGAVRGLGRRLGQWSTRRLERFVVEHTPAVIVTAPELAARFPRAERLVVIRPVHEVPPRQRDAATVRAELGLAGPLVVCAARLHPQKGLDLLLDAVPALPTGTTVVVAGDGPDRQALVARATPFGPAVRFLGARPDVVDLLAAADVVVIPSRWESGPLVLLEALSVGAAVVTTDVGFVRAITDASPDAAPFVVVAPEAPALGEAVSRLLGDPTARRAVGEAGRAAVQSFLDRAPGLAATTTLYRAVAPT